jgi:flagellar hook-associated protein 3 FlgL
MRITNNMLARAQFDGLSMNMAALMKAQAQMTSGHRLQQASDDPTAATQIMASATSLRALDQYKSNVQRSASRIAQEDDVLQQIGDLITRAKEVGIQQGSATGTAQTRSIASEEVRELFNQIVTLGNTRFGDEYLFGGDQSTTAPFAASGTGASLDYTTTTPSGTRSVQIGEGQSMQIAHDGSQILLNTGVLDAVKALGRALDQASPTYGSTGITAAMSSIDSAFTSVQNLVGDVGAKSRQLEMAQQNVDAYRTNLTVFKSNLEDVEVEQAITELTSRQTAYQAALLSTTKVLGLTLTDYLR